MKWHFCGMLLFGGFYINDSFDGTICWVIVDPSFIQFNWSLLSNKKEKQMIWLSSDRCDDFYPFDAYQLWPVEKENIYIHEATQKQFP